MLSRTHLLGIEPVGLPTGDIFDQAVADHSSLTPLCNLIMFLMDFLSKPIEHLSHAMRLIARP
jgi:hypothetical protein